VVVLARLVQHLLIWFAATISIVLGAVGGQTVGYLSHRTDRRVVAWGILTAALIFAGGLVQRMPAAIALLVGFGALMVGLGGWLAAAGAPQAGLVYLIIGLVYVLTLGPSTYRWLRRS
jgi:hypothetical protein